MEKERFSLLLLEPNEIYFEDFSVDLINKNQNEPKTTGRLKICSKSLVFDPIDISLPLIKLRLNDCTKITDSIEIDAEYHKDFNKYKFLNNCLIVGCTQSIYMLNKNAIAPYEFKREIQLFLFEFHYAKVNDQLHQLQQLKRASTLQASDQNDMIATIVFSRHNRIKFDLLWLDNIDDKILFDAKVDEVLPLITNPGRLLLTENCIYFQPYNNILPFPVIRIKLCYIKNFTKRRYLLRHTGLEIIWNNPIEDDMKNNNLYVSFRNVQERIEFMKLVEAQKEFNLPKLKPESMTLKWQNQLISNYDYLLYLNSLADRTFKDLTQYPIFPWVLKNYDSETIDLEDEINYRDLTKPMGALSDERLQRLIERSQEMGEPKYLYGSHYSTPGFVLFYLVRKFPNLMLCMQNGKFDDPNRMFNNVSIAFNNCLKNMSDFKELIPEFYDLNEKGEFLLNSSRINFGIRADGAPVNHVTFPPWANRSAEKFIEIMRNALESDYVSKNLHHWIDLIFGYKQRGEEAEKCYNIFHPICYEGSVDLDTIRDATTRHAYEVQISEFGQIPKQIFDKPHVAKNLEKYEPNTSRKLSLNLDHNKKFNLSLINSYIAHKDEITSICIDNDSIASTAKDGILKYYSIKEKRQIRSIPFGSNILSSCVKVPNSDVLAIGSWNDKIFLYNCNYGKITDEIPAHDDSVSCLNLVDELGILISGSWDRSVKVWKGFTGIDYKKFRLSDSMVAYLPLDDKIMCITNKICDNNLQIFIGIETGDILLWNIKINEINEYVDSEPKLFVHHKKCVNSLACNFNGTKLASCEDGILVVTDIKTGMNLFDREIESNITNMCWYNVNDLVLCADDCGNLSIWDMIEGVLKFKMNIFNGPINCINYSIKNDLIVTGGKDNNEFKIKYWKLD